MAIISLGAWAKLLGLLDTYHLPAHGVLPVGHYFDISVMLNRLRLQLAYYNNQARQRTFIAFRLHVPGSAWSWDGHLSMPGTAPALTAPQATHCQEFGAASVCQAAAACVI